MSSYKETKNVLKYNLNIIFCCFIELDPCIPPNVYIFLETEILKRAVTAHQSEERMIVMIVGSESGEIL